MPVVNEIRTTDKIYTQNKIDYSQLHNSYFGNRFDVIIDSSKPESLQILAEIFNDPTTFFLTISNNSIYFENQNIYGHILLISFSPNENIIHVYQFINKNRQAYKLPIMQTSGYVHQEQKDLYLKEVKDQYTYKIEQYTDDLYTIKDETTVYTDQYPVLLNTNFFYNNTIPSSTDLGLHISSVIQNSIKSDVFQLLKNKNLSDYISLPKTYNYNYELVAETNLNKYKNPVLTNKTNISGMPLFYYDKKEFQLTKSITQRSLDDIAVNGLELTLFDGTRVPDNEYVFEVYFDYQTNKLTYYIYTNKINEPLIQHINVVEDEQHLGLNLKPVQICDVVGTDYVQPTGYEFVRENEIINSIKLVGSNNFLHQNQLIQSRYRNNGKILNIDTNNQYFKLNTTAYKVKDKTYKVEQIGIKSININNSSVLVENFNQHNGFIKTTEDLGQEIEVEIEFDLINYNQMLLKTDDSNGKDVRLLWNNSVVELPQTNVILENIMKEDLIESYHATMHLFFSPETTGYWKDSLVDEINGISFDGYIPEEEDYKQDYYTLNLLPTYYGQLKIPVSSQNTIQTYYLTTDGILTTNTTDYIEIINLRNLNTDNFDYLQLSQINNLDYTKEKNILNTDSELFNYVELKNITL